VECLAVWEALTGPFRSARKYEEGRSQGMMQELEPRPLHSNGRSTHITSLDLHRKAGRARHAYHTYTLYASYECFVRAAGNLICCRRITNDNCRATLGARKRSRGISAGRAKEEGGTGDTK